jgi:putative FmdB family regulatory protein
VPRYDVRCRACHVESEVFAHVADVIICPVCDGAVDRLMPLVAIKVDTIRGGYYDIGLGEHIESESHRKRVMVQKGLVQAPDNGNRHGTRGIAVSAPGLRAESRPRSGYYA